MLLVVARSRAWRETPWDQVPYRIYFFANNTEEYRNNLHTPEYHDWEILEEIEISDTYIKDMVDHKRMVYVFREGSREEDMKEYTRIFYFGLKYGRDMDNKKGEVT